MSGNKRTGRDGAAVLATVALAVLPTVAFLGMAWHSHAVREASVWLDLFSPYILLDLAALCACASAYGAFRKRDANSRANTRWPGNPLASYPSFGLVLGMGSLMFTLPLVHVWAAAPSLYGCIGGLLPYSDAFQYYDGAVRLLAEGRLDAWNSRRPINALLFTVRLALAGGDLRGALLIQAALLGVSCALLALVIARDRGLTAGLLLFAILYAVAREHVRTTMSEALGLTLGALAATILWCGARDGRRYVVAFGLMMMTIALNARAGAFFTLPALIVWAGWALRDPGGRFAWRSAALATAAVAMAFVVNSFWLKAYGAGFGAGNGNFAFTFYGFSTGHPGWTRLYVDHPESRLFSEAAVNHFAYSQALENARRRPLDLLLGIWRGTVQWSHGLWAYTRAILSLVPYESHLNAFFQLLLAIGAVRWLWMNRGGRITWLLVAANIGLLASGGIVFPDIGHRGLVVSYPMLFLVAALGASAWRRLPEGRTRPITDGPPGTPWPAIFLSLTLILAASLGPAVAHGLGEARLIDPADHPADEDVLIARIGPGTPYIDVLAPGSEKSTFVPRIRDEDLARDVADWPEHLAGVDPSGRLHGPAVVMLAYNLQRDRPGTFWVVGPPTIRPERWRTVRLIGKIRQAGWFRYFYVRDYQPED